MKSEDWIGYRHGRLTVESFEGLRSFGRGKAAYFRFRCDCGNALSAQKSNIIGKRVDCGCSKPVSDRTYPPGATGHPLRKVWWHMIERCENERNKSFKDYGARGIKVCNRWKTGSDGLTGFECFLSDMGPRPTGMTIERVQGDRGYEPGNCIWLPKGDQSKNRRNVRLLRIGDRIKTIPEWCEETGVLYFTAMMRIRRGWKPDTAVTRPAVRR